MKNNTAETNILFIVNMDTTRRTLVEILAGTGFKLEFSRGGDDGERKAAEILPLMIVIDANDEIMNGIELCRRLRVNPLQEGVPILLIADHENKDLHAIGLSAGADDFLETPLDAVLILARLRSLTRFNRGRYLRADLTRFSWMVEHAHEGYLMLDKSSAIHFANERAMHLLNIPEDFFGLPFVKVVERLYVPKPVEAWATWLEDPSPCFLVQPESPTARAVWVVLEALEPLPGVEYFRVVRLRDVTERMSIYQDMRRFHTVIAHKLRTPMSMLMMSVGILKNQLDLLSPDEIKKTLGSTIKGTNRLAEEVRDILTFIDAPLALNIGLPMSLGQLPEMIKSSCAGLHINHVSLSLPDNLHLHKIAITTDALELVFHELLENSRKFHPRHEPVIEISVTEIEQGYIEVVLSDNGLTLSVEQLQWAWLPYFQGEKDFTGELPGLGLGFPMVATLIWKAGGDINLRNRADGTGVIVDLKIPLESTMRQMERSAAPFGS